MVGRTDRRNREERWVEAEEKNRAQGNRRAQLKRGHDISGRKVDVHTCEEKRGNGKYSQRETREDDEMNQIKKNIKCHV